MSDLQPAAITPKELDPVLLSVAHEKLLETVFLADLLQHCWFDRAEVVDVMHSSVDAFGYDLALECGDVLRHVQLKSRRPESTTRDVKVNIELARRPSGCVIWLEWSQDMQSNGRVHLDYWWFGGEPGQPIPDLGDRIARHSKGDATGKKKERPNIRLVGKKRFDLLEGGVEELAVRLFGPVSAAGE